MKSNSCNVCASPGSIETHGRVVNQRPNLHLKSVGCVMRHNPPVSTKMRDIEDEVKRMWYIDNRFIIKRLAFELKRPSLDIMNFLYKISFTNFGQAMKLINGRRKASYIPLTSANYDIYFEIFDNDGNIRNPIRMKCLEQLLQIMRVAFAETSKRKKSGVSSLSGVLKAKSIKLPAYRNKNDYNSSCAFSGQLSCKPYNDYKIDGRYAGVKAGGLVGYRADAIGKQIMRLGCKRSCKGAKVQTYWLFDVKSKYDEDKDGLIQWPRYDHREPNVRQGFNKKWLKVFEDVLPSESEKGKLNGMKKEFVSPNGREIPKIYKTPLRRISKDELPRRSNMNYNISANDDVKPQNQKHYFADPIPVAFHEPFDTTKPWTWLRRHPNQMRLNDKGKLTSSNIQRYRRSSVEANFKKANKRLSIQSSFSNTSKNIQPMFG